VVSDARQSIYRFRGASPANMAWFDREYPRAQRDQLAINYRSSTEIVGTVQSIAEQMSLPGVLPLAFTSEHGPAGVKPQITSFAGSEGEAKGIADEIRTLEREGVAFRDQAVLCRSNAR